MADEQKKDPPLQLTDTPNVAQVIRIYRELERQRKQHAWYRRAWRALTSRGQTPGTEKVAVEATVIAIDRASRAKKRFDAAGKPISVIEE